VATGKVDSRVANNADNITDYLKRLGTIKPIAKRRGKFSIRDHLSQTERPSPVVATPPAHKRASTSRSAIPKGLKCFCPDARINDIFDELRKLKLDKHPNASAALLRLLLEFSVSHYLDTTGHIKPLLDGFREKENKGPDWYPTLRQLTNHLLAIDIGLQPLELKALRKFVHTRNQANTLDALDGFVHNRRVDPTEPEIRATVRLIEPLLRVTLARTEAPS
jgi:hypothetical protein